MYLYAYDTRAATNTCATINTVAPPYVRNDKQPSRQSSTTPHATIPNRHDQNSTTPHATINNRHYVWNDSSFFSRVLLPKTPSRLRKSRWLERWHRITRDAVTFSDAESNSRCGTGSTVKIWNKPRATVAAEQLALEATFAHLQRQRRRST